MNARYPIERVRCAIIAVVAVDVGDRANNLGRPHTGDGNRREGGAIGAASHRRGTKDTRPLSLGRASDVKQASGSSVQGAFSGRFHARNVRVVRAQARARSRGFPNGVGPRSDRDIRGAVAVPDIGSLLARPRTVRARAAARGASVDAVARVAATTIKAAPVDLKIEKTGVGCGDQILAYLNRARDADGDLKRGLTIAF